MDGACGTRWEEVEEAFGKRGEVVAAGGMCVACAGADEGKSASWKSAEWAVGAWKRRSEAVEGAVGRM